MFEKIFTIAGLAAAGLLLIVVTMTTPTDSGAFGILSVFMLSYVVILTIVTYLLWFIAKLINKFGLDIKLIRKPKQMSLKKAYYYSTIIAIGPVIIVSLQSVSTVGVYEISLTTIFIVLGCLYVSRRTA